MILLAFGVVLFAALHLLPVMPTLKQQVKAKVGEALYGPAYGAVSIVAVVLIVLGWRQSDFVTVYDPPGFGAPANFVFMFAAFQCLAIFLFRGRLRQVLRFPMGIAVVLWATGHLLANGDAASLILFGGLMAYALIHMGLGFANGSRPAPEVRGGHDLAGFFAGTAMYAAMIQLHPVLIGVPVLTLF